MSYDSRRVWVTDQKEKKQHVNAVIHIMERLCSSELIGKLRTETSATEIRSLIEKGLLPEDKDALNALKGKFNKQLASNSAIGYMEYETAVEIFIQKKQAAAKNAERMRKEAEETAKKMRKRQAEAEAAREAAGEAAREAAGTAKKTAEQAQGRKWQLYHAAETAMSLKRRTNGISK